MSVKVANNRLIVPSLEKRLEFYQHIHSKVSGFNKLGQWLISQAEQLQDFRQSEELEVIAQMLSNLPLWEHQLAGQYYLSWCKYRNGEDSRSSFESVIEQSDAYRAKSLTSLAGLEVARGDYETAVKHYKEAMRWSGNISAFVSAAKSIAAYKSVEGYHQAALKDLETLYPLIRYTTPKVYYDYLNSYVVELTNAGRLEEAGHFCRVILASPYAFAYPEWRETANDIDLKAYKSRSSVRVIQSFPGNLVSMPQREPSATSTHPAIFGSAPIVGLKEWKDEKMVKEPNGNEELPEDMSIQEITMKILELITENKDDEIRLRKVLDYAVDVFSKKK